MVNAVHSNELLIPVLLLVPSQACTVLRVEGGAGDLQILHTTIRVVKKKERNRSYKQSTASKTGTIIYDKKWRSGLKQ